MWRLDAGKNSKAFRPYRAPGSVLAPQRTLPTARHFPCNPQDMARLELIFESLIRIANHSHLRYLSLSLVAAAIHV